MVDSGNARVERFEADGEFLGAWGDRDRGGVTFARTKNGLGPTGITVGPDGRTWVADTWGHRVVALDPNGVIVQTIGGETVDVENDPARVNEAAAVSSARARSSSPMTPSTSRHGQRASPAVHARRRLRRRLGWLRFRARPTYRAGRHRDRTGRKIYVADSGNARIAIFTPDGQPVAQWPIADWPAATPGGLPPAYQPYLAFDAAGNLYATASNAGQVLILDREGRVATRVTETDGEQLAQPVGVAVAPDGKVYISDVGRDAVLSYGPAPVVSVGRASLLRPGRPRDHSSYAPRARDPRLLLLKAPSRGAGEQRTASFASSDGLSQTGMLSSLEGDNGDRAVDLNVVIVEERRNRLRRSTGCRGLVPSM